MGRREGGLVRAVATAGAVAIVAIVGLGGDGARADEILPRAGALALGGDCALTLDGTLYSDCQCNLAINVIDGQTLVNGPNVACRGQGGRAGGLSGLVGVPGRSIQILYDVGPTSASGNGMWVTTSSAVVENVATNEGWLLLTMRLAGPTNFENSRGRGCIDGATASRC
ncbi:MAG: hypothetical protein R3F55_02995 [Alphaproteobacteria bacterium]